MADWQAMADRLAGEVDFLIEPYIRFRGEPGEQATMFFTDPSGNAIEIKAFADMSRLFAR
jgi:extradiol dioxygenase family protein